MLRRLTPPALHRPLAGLLVCALLLTQALGLLHRVLHAHGPSHAAAHEPSRIEALFAHHHDPGDCRIFDQLSDADGVGQALVEAGAMPPPSLGTATPSVPLRPAATAGYLARGPPRMA